MEGEVGFFELLGWNGNCGQGENFFVRRHCEDFEVVLSEDKPRRRKKRVMDI